MGLITKYILEREDSHEEFPAAYIKIIKVVTSNEEFEFFKNVDDPERPDIAQEIDWIRKIESIAIAYVWSDEGARKNRAQVIDWFEFKFEYDLDSLDNVFQQAYSKLHEIFENSEDIL